MTSQSNRKPPLIWLNIIIFAVSLGLAVIITPWYGFTHGYGIEHLIWLLVAFSFTNLSITAGYHRLWSHKAYEAHPVLRVLFALGGAFALQNSALHWSSDHRVHHKFVDDNDKDPYSAKRGFWFSHIGWMLRDYNQSHNNDYKNCRDLKRDKIVMWQHKYYVPLAVATNVLIPLALGLLHQDIIGMFLIVGALRLTLSHHSTFFINSLAHVWGKQTFTDKNTARDNGVLALLTFGEGYHNFHHIFENDYRNGIHWWDYDPTKWLIKAGTWVGLTSKLRRTSSFKIAKAKEAMLLKKAQARIALKSGSDRVLDQLQSEFDALVATMEEYYEVKKQLMESKKGDIVKRYERAVLKIRYQQIQLSLKTRKQSWHTLLSRYAVH
ncbi:fatty acid desaturase [Vibrio sp. JC009]|uniref:acyl-CoA desaturase n=1 Tax=Vibrio sp. JC009 TaxID=2912314 RepID=UPI0023AE7538|nr:fatty acid desaturase [Vibrio sp. JC009]WED23580.1 fatty acid desaturase [Vibrio sp. JC009]